MLQGLQVLTSLVAMPVIIMGDFNLNEAQLREAGWPTQAGLVSLRTDCHPTVVQSGGRSVDHVFVTARGSRMCSSAGLAAAGCADHLGVTFDIHRRPRSLQGLVFYSTYCAAASVCAAPTYGL